MLFQTSMIPASVDTFEKLICWAIRVGATAIPAKAVQERDPNIAQGDTGVQFAFESIGPIQTTSGERWIGRVSFGVPLDWASPVYDGLWDAIQPVATADAPANMIATP